MHWWSDTLYRLFHTKEHFTFSLSLIRFYSICLFYTLTFSNVSLNSLWQCAKDMHTIHWREYKRVCMCYHKRTLNYKECNHINSMNWHSEGHILYVLYVCCSVCVTLPFCSTASITSAGFGAAEHPLTESFSHHYVCTPGGSVMCHCAGCYHTAFVAVLTKNECTVICVISKK